MLNGLRSWLFGSSGRGTPTNDSGSKLRAKSRLHFVLVQDRTGLTTEEMTRFKKEMVAVIEKYFVIEDRELDINYKRDNDSTTLLINSPVRVRRPKDEAGKAVANSHGGRRGKHRHHHNNEVTESQEEESASNSETPQPAPNS